LILDSISHRRLIARWQCLRASIAVTATAANGVRLLLGS
jgi:hypothetical protein